MLARRPDPGGQSAGQGSTQVPRSSRGRGRAKGLWEVGGRWACAAGGTQSGATTQVRDAVTVEAPQPVATGALSWATSQFPGPRASRDGNPPTRPHPHTQACASSHHRHQRCPGTQPSTRQSPWQQAACWQEPRLALASREGGLDRPWQGSFLWWPEGPAWGEQEGDLWGARRAHAQLPGKVAVSPARPFCSRPHWVLLRGAGTEGQPSPVCWVLPTAERTP